LKPLDIEIMKRLGTRVNLIPVIAKADTLTQNDLALFKARVSTFICVLAVMTMPLLTSSLPDSGCDSSSRHPHLPTAH
jgi:septin family protein